jgi:hypothetical protein
MSTTHSAPDDELNKPPQALPASRTRARSLRAWLHLPGRLLLSIALLAAFAGTFLLVGLYFLLPDDAELAQRAETSLSESLGVPVTIGSLQWRLLPAPSIVIDNAATVQPQPIRIQRMLLRPDIPALLARRVVFKRIEVNGATVPQLSLRALAATPHEREPKGLWRVEPVAPAWLYFRDLNWVSRRGLALAYDGEIHFEPDWRPRDLAIRRPGVRPEATMTLALQPARPNGLTTWTVHAEVGGGQSDGELRLRQTASGRLLLEGNLQSKGVDVASLASAFGREPAVGGRAAAPTTIWAEGDSFTALTRSLHTRSRLSIANARLLRFDLDKAVRTVGRDHAGQTPLDTLTLQLDTQNTAQGMVTDYSNVKAVSGALKASGRGRLSVNRELDAEFEVDLVGGLVGVPLTLSGPPGDIQVSVPASAVAGAAVGTALLPGVGTIVGARVGATVGKLFGDRKPAPRTSNKAKPAPQPANKRLSARRTAQPAPPRQTIMPVQGGPDR